MGVRGRRCYPVLDPQMVAQLGPDPMYAILKICGYLRANDWDIDLVVTMAQHRVHILPDFVTGRQVVRYVINTGWCGNDPGPDAGYVPPWGF